MPPLAARMQRSEFFHRPALHQAGYGFKAAQRSSFSAPVSERTHFLGPARPIPSSGSWARSTVDSLSRYTQSEEQRFERSVRALDEVIACYAIAGEADFLLQVVAVDLDGYAEFATTIIRRLPGIKEMHTMFVLKDIKPNAVLPIRD